MADQFKDIGGYFAKKLREKRQLQGEDGDKIDRMVREENPLQWEEDKNLSPDAANKRRQEARTRIIRLLAERGEL
jgi:predicted transposase YbfD/YdcC